jgi:hypothetical protein
MKKAILFVVISLLIIVPVSGRETEQQIWVGWAMLFNVVPGFGLGSFLQGDWLCGYIQLAADVIGIGLFVYSGVTAYQSFMGDPAAILSGVAFMFSSRVYGFCRPICYKVATSQRNEVSFSAVPSIEPRADRWGYDIGIEFAVRYELD